MVKQNPQLTDILHDIQLIVCMCSSVPVFACYKYKQMLVIHTFQYVRMAFE